MDEAWLHDLFEPFGPISIRRMFGGFGIYRDGLMFALVADGVLHMKADAETEPALMAAGSGPFAYEGRGRPVRTSYWRLPEEALDDPDALLRWARLAFEASLRARKPARGAGRRA